VDFACVVAIYDRRELVKHALKRRRFLNKGLGDSDPKIYN
jgi:hypothetical protein